MCGIAIIFYHNGSTPEAWRARAMHRALAHRGPDAANVVLRAGVALAHARLSIVDIQGGAQPMQTPDGQYAITYNGEIYNYRQLRQSLIERGLPFRSQSDTEVVLNAYREFGARALVKLRGMFAFAIHDRYRGELFMARDRLGIKPLYYYNDERVFVAASEIKAIYASGLVKPELNRASIQNYFSYQFAIAPHTAFTHIYELPPAHSLCINAGNAPRISRYWDLNFPAAGDYESMDETYWTQQFTDTFQNAVTSHGIGEAPIGSYLSGGIDSCSITRLLADSQPRLQTFSIGFDNADYDESSQYRAIAASMGVANAELRLQDERPQGYLDDLVQCIYHLEQPQRMAVDIPHYLLSGLVRQKTYKVVYTGDGADELLAGYDCFRQDQMRVWSNGPLKSRLRRWYYLRRHTRYFPREHMRLLLALHTRRTQQHTINRFGFYPAWHDFWQITRQQRTGIMREDASINGEAQMDALVAGMQSHLVGRDALNQSLYFELKTRLPGWILWKSDRLSMAHGVEARVPFLDHPLVELIARMPPQMKLNGLNEKYILKKSMLPRLPETAHGYRKRGFYTPISAWFFTSNRREELAPYLSREALIKTDLFDPERVMALQRELQGISKPLDLQTGYRLMRIEWILFTVLTTQILHHLYMGNHQHMMPSKHTVLEC
ncbi:MAG: asparagine synthase (glutamine-hydrolyzing) [Gammaproteobacteria bacterium]|nr:asparagine synthase (glutamine-hydrolyzing) [Gammaproteobacteria bacterium]